MNWKNEGFILSKRKFRENAIILEVFTSDFGKVNGIVYGGTSRKVKNSQEKVIVPKGLEVNETFSITYYDAGLGTEQIASGITDAITNKEYEERINDNKRNIFLIKPRFVGLIIEEMENVMPYPKGSTQYISPTVVKGENIRIYD